MIYDILNAADHQSRNQYCPLVIREQLMMVFHSKSLSKRIQYLGDEVSIEFFNLSYNELQDVYFRDVAVCRNQKHYIMARTTIPSNSYRFFEQRFSIANQFPLGYFLFFGHGNLRIFFKIEFTYQPPDWFASIYPDIKFVIKRCSRWQMNQNNHLDLEEIFL
ncbi:MAG: hypothetical protein EBY16_02505 [Gammaproteobacteria bacterium]|nr:hypothetical protein [Gammaproteobacteria bacterium]